MSRTRYYKTEKYITWANEEDMVAVAQLQVTSCPRCYSGVCVGQPHCAFCFYGLSKTKELAGELEELITELNKK